MAIRLGFVGLGWVVREVWLPRFCADPDFHVSGGYDPSSVSIERVRESWHRNGGKTEFTVYESREALAADKLDLVVIATPNHQHCVDCCYFLHRDISVLVEKPVCTSSAELAQLELAAVNSKGRLIPSHAIRYREDVASMKEHLLRDSNRILGLEVEWVRAKGVPSPGSWFTYSRYAGGGVTFDLGWHVLDLALMFLDYPMPSRAVAIMNALRLNDGTDWRKDSVQENPYPTDVEDCSTGFLSTETRAGIYIKTAWSSNNISDVCSINVDGNLYGARLYTTFGFSPNRVKKPTLTLLEAGKARMTELDDRVTGSEYDQMVCVIKDSLSSSGNNIQCIEELKSLIHSLEMLYHSAGDHDFYTDTIESCV